MAQIEVSELLHDADFVDNIIHIKRTSVVDNEGKNNISEIPVSSIGAVQPISGRDILRVPEALRVASMYTFFFKGKIIASAPGKYSSILVFNCQRYEVQHVYDWSNYGPGFTEGVCVAEVPA